MTDAELLNKIKKGLGLTGDFHNDTLQVYIDEVKSFLASSGIARHVIESDVAVGCIMRGVADLWHYGSGNANLSNYFKMRLIQLKKETVKPIVAEKIAPYLFKKTYDFIDYKVAEDFFKKYKPSVGLLQANRVVGRPIIMANILNTLTGFCSAVRSDNYFGRNYDWYYNEQVSFVVYTPAKNGKHAVLGMAQGTKDLTQEVVESGVYSESYEIVPFLLQDGINDAGLICEINVCPTGDKGLTRGTNKDGDDLCAIMIPRFVLDNAANVDEAIQLLTARNIYCPNNSGFTQELHFMLADANKTAVVEFVENKMVIIEDFINDKPIMTNFYLDGYDGTRESLTDYAMGIERQAILTDNYEQANSEFGMLSLMLDVKYTKAYSDDISPLWYSEFCGNYGDPYGNLTKDSPPEDYEPILEIARQRFSERTRNSSTWQTVHTSVYNFNEKKLTVVPQESNETFTFKLEV